MLPPRAVAAVFQAAQRQGDVGGEAQQQSLPPAKA